MYGNQSGLDYTDTPDADPVHVYDNVLVALDPERRLNNGEPAALLRWLDSLELRPGERFLHVGCGVGYYTAIAAFGVRPGGRVTGIEIDPELAARARRNLEKDGDIEIVSGDGSAVLGRTFDAIYVNAGATEIVPPWLDSLAPGGRLLVPLTVGVTGMNLGAGCMLLVRRASGAFSAEFRGPVGIYHCAGARTDAGDARLRALFANGQPAGVRRLRRERHREDETCDLHGETFCLSKP
jgi:protein-L-isoaspartate(D-aspartate) O-methyltransferase